MSPTPTNRLIHETSPYLRQHAHNPVDWYPWGDEALQKAKGENKPILLSIGYSACHWCHVMEHESFENEEISTLMNSHFVNIKVDREERPDLDQIYQNALQLFGRNGGWPLTMFLTPDTQPFFGGTYFPPIDRFGITSFPKVLVAIAEAYRDRQEDIQKTTQDVLRILTHRSTGTKTSDAEMPLEVIDKAVTSLTRLYDPAHGGFGSAPKFPNTMVLSLCLRHYHRTRDTGVCDIVTQTLRNMAQGGVYDQLGGGFHRYSVDARWLVPHFEKMLYDNALLSRLLMETYQVTGDPFFKTIAEEILHYVMREMQDTAGGYYSTQDADSEGEEGRFFVWSPQEVLEVLGREEAPIFCKAYDVTDAGNFEGKNILHVDRPLKALASEFGRSEETIQEILYRSKQRLFSVRENRVKPHRDEKVLTSWNGLMISGFASGYQATRNPVYLASARKAAAFILDHLCPQGRLLRVHKDGQGKLNGYLDDYAFFTAALIDLFETTFDTFYLDHADRLTHNLVDQFWDHDDGGFFFTSRDHESLIQRPKSGYDQAIPSGNAVAAMNLLRLSHYRDNAEFAEKGERLLRLYFDSMNDNPFGFGSMFSALDYHLQRPLEIVLIGKIGNPNLDAMIQGVQGTYLPNKVLYHVDLESDQQKQVPGFAEGTSQAVPQPSATVCHRFTCSKPVSGWQELKALLAS